jgi:chromosome partitioning protein
MIITVGHKKGGVGKSTIAVNLAAEFARLGKDVMLVDADPGIRTSSQWIADRAEGDSLAVIHHSQQEGNIRTALLDFGKRYETVIVDVAGRDSKELRTALTASDLVVIPNQPSQADLDSLKDVLETVDEARDFNPDLKALAVLSRVSTHIFSRSAAEALDYFSDFPTLSVAQTRIHDRTVYQSCIPLGRGVVEMADRKAKAEVQLLAQEVSA